MTTVGNTRVGPPTRVAFGTSRRWEIGATITAWTRGHGWVTGRVTSYYPATHEVDIIDSRGRHWRVPAATR